MNTKRADLALRLALILVGLGSIVLFVFLATATEAWPAAGRLAVLLVPAGIALAALMAAAELREPFEERTRYGARRRGASDAIQLRDDIGNRTARLPSSPAQSAPDMRFGIRRRNTIAALALSAGSTAVLAPVALHDLQQPDVTETGFVAIVVLAPSLFYLTRSIIRLATASLAIRLDGERLMLGVALGFVPPLRLRRAELCAVVDARGSTNFVHFVVDATTGYRVRTAHLEDADALLDALETRWPDVPVVTHRQHHDRAPSFEDLAPSAGRPAPGQSGQPGDIAAPVLSLDTTGQAGAATPPADRIKMARRVLRRRTWLAGTVFLMTFVSMFAASWWYLVQRSANDRLLAEGSVIPATVIDVDRNARGPDSIEVAFDHDGVEYVRTIQSGFFSRFSPELKRTEVPVYFDQENATLVRLEGRRNIHEATWIALAGAGAIGLLGALALARTLHDRSTVTTARWSRRRIHGIPRSGRKPATIVVEGLDGAPPVELRGATGLGKRSLASVPSWLGVSRRTVVVLPDAPDDVLLTATLTREQSETMPAGSP